MKAPAELDFQSLDRIGVASSFLECPNGWKPPWARDSHAIGSGAVRAICLAAPVRRQPRSGTEARFACSGLVALVWLCRRIPESQDEFPTILDCRRFKLHVFLLHIC